MVNNKKSPTSKNSQSEEKPLINDEINTSGHDVTEKTISSFGESEKSVFIPMNEQKIHEIASQNAQKKISFNDLVWYVSENELRLKDAIPIDQNPLLGKKPSEVRVFLNHVVKSPSQDEVRKFAQNLANLNPSIQDLNWNLAVRQYIFDLIKNKLGTK